MSCQIILGHMALALFWPEAGSLRETATPFPAHPMDLSELDYSASEVHDHR